MKKIVSLFALALTFGATVASADPLMKYDYVDVAYQWRHNNTDAPEISDSNGLDSKVSYSPIEHFALEGGYNYAQAKVFENSDFNFNTFTYGILGYEEICPGIQVLARVGGKHFDTNGTIGDIRSSQSVDRVYAGIGSRYLLTDEIEVDADITWTATNDATINGPGGNWTYGGTAFYTILENVALKAGASIDNDSNVALTGGVRVAM